MRLWLIVFAALIAFLARDICDASAQSYPNKPIRITVPFAAATHSHSWKGFPSGSVARNRRLSGP